MKTNWEGLSEKVKEVFAEFYIYIKQNEMQRTGLEVKRICVSHGLPCSQVCWTLFPETYNNKCPCQYYKDDEAFKALEQCLIEDGWIEEDD